MRRSVQLITLHCVLAAAEEGSILAASRRIGMHHSALSRRIRELEAELGVMLFDRHPGGVRPTEIGEQFLERIGTILTDLDGTLTVVEQAADRSGLVIGFEETILATRVIGLVTGFSKRRPTVGVRFREACRTTLVEALHQRELDLLITFDPGGDGANLAVPFWHDGAFVMMPVAHPLAASESIEWSKVQGEPLLLAERINTSWCWPLLEQLDSPGTAKAVVRHDVSRECLLALVCEGLGITLLREDELPSNRNGLVAVPLSDVGGPIRIPCFARWLDDNTNPVLAAFVRFLRGRRPNS